MGGTNQSLSKTTSTETSKFLPSLYSGLTRKTDSQNFRNVNWKLQEERLKCYVNGLRAKWDPSDTVKTKSNCSKAQGHVSTPGMGKPQREFFQDLQEEMCSGCSQLLTSGLRGW